MHFFYILAHGHTFDVGQFLSTSTLIPSLKWNVGQKSHGMLHAKTDGFIIYLAADKSLSYQNQQDLALEFVRENEKELLRCRSFPGVDYFLLSLHFVLPLNDSMFGFATNMNQNLLSACVSVGLEPSIFVQFDRETDGTNLLDINSEDTE
jgi:hypothetical protein